MNLLAQIPGPQGRPGSPAPEVPDIRDILPPTQPPDILQLTLTIILISLALCLIAYAVILILRLRKTHFARTAPPPPPSEVAHAALEVLHANAPNLTANEFGLETSNIIKHYFHDRYDDPLLFETSEEFAIRENHKKSIPRSKRIALGEFFERCDLLKYANAPDAEEEADPLLEEALALIHEPNIPEVTTATTPYVNHHAERQ